MTSKQNILYLDLVCPQLKHEARISEFAAAGAHQFAKLEIRQVLLLDRSSAISKISRSFFVLPLRLSSWQASVFKQRTLWGPSVSSQVKLSSSRQVVEQWKMRPLFWGRFDKNLSVRSYLANKNFRSSKIYWSSTHTEAEIVFFISKLRIIDFLDRKMCLGIVCLCIHRKKILL